MADLDPPVSRILSERNVAHRVFRHPGPVHSLAQAAAERGQQPEQVVRSLLFHVADGEYVMVLAAGPAQISWKALRRHLGQSRLTTADREEVRRITGYEIGAVGPFGIPPEIRVLVDEGVLAQKEVSIGSGARGTAVILHSADLLRALGDAEVISLQEPE